MPTAVTVGQCLFEVGSQPAAFHLAGRCWPPARCQRLCGVNERHGAAARPASNQSPGRRSSREGRGVQQPCKSSVHRPHQNPVAANGVCDFLLPLLTFHCRFPNWRVKRSAANLRNARGSCCSGLPVHPSSSLLAQLPPLKHAFRAGCSLLSAKTWGAPPPSASCSVFLTPTAFGPQGHLPPSQQFRWPQDDTSHRLPLGHLSSVAMVTMRRQRLSRGAGPWGHGWV